MFYSIIVSKKILSCKKYLIQVDNYIWVQFEFLSFNFCYFIDISYAIIETLFNKKS